MLYVSTRNAGDSYTAYRALHENYAPDGGLFAPYRLPVFSNEECKRFVEKTFGERVAKILNIFFPIGLNGWDVDFAIGRYPYKLVSMNHRVYIAELWNNLNGSFAFVEKNLYSKMCEEKQVTQHPSHWARVAIRISLLASVCCELVKANVTRMDFAGITGDYLFVVAAWYVRKMGFPIGKIICKSDENGNAWDFFHKGIVPCVFLNSCELNSYLELLIYEMLGDADVERFLASCAKRVSYQLDEEQLLCISQNMEGAVVSRKRFKALIRSIFSTHNYLADPYTAIAYGGLQDYRSRTGESCTTLMIADTNPCASKEMIIDAERMSVEELRKQINNQ